MIIDCHCHAGKGDKMTAPWNTDAPIEPYLRRARAAGIDKTIVLAPLHGNYEQANRQVASIVARYPRATHWICLCPCETRCRQNFQHGEACRDALEIQGNQGSRL